MIINIFMIIIKYERRAETFILNKLVPINIFMIIIIFFELFGQGGLMRVWTFRLPGERRLEKYLAFR